MPRTAPSHIALHDVGHRLPDGRWLLRAVTFGVGDERVGLIGPNGSGKSTILRLIAGELHPTSGHVHRSAGVRAVRPQRYEPTVTVAQVLGVDAILDALTRVECGDGSAAELATIGDAWDTPARARAALRAVGIDHLPFPRPMRDVSGGEATRLTIAAQLLADPAALVLDEPTNDLDVESREALYALVSRWRGGVLVATHDRELLERMDRIVAIERESIVSYGGGWSLYAEEIARQQATAVQAAEHARAEVRAARRNAQEVRERQARRDAAGRRFRETGSQSKLLLNANRERSEHTGARLTERSARSVEGAEARLRIATERVDERAPLMLELPSTALPNGTTVVELRAARIGPAVDQVLLDDVSLLIRGPERIAITGRNGSGKSTLLRVLAGTAPLLRGECRRGVPLARVAYLDQHTRLLDRGPRLVDVFTVWHPTLGRTEVRTALARFHFRADDGEREVSSLSGGERMRAGLACVLSGATVPQCLILDEPTNHLDLESLRSVESVLASYDGALVVVSHDRRFLEAIGVQRVVPIELWQSAPRHPVSPVGPEDSNR